MVQAIGLSIILSAIPYLALRQSQSFLIGISFIIQILSNIFEFVVGETFVSTSVISWWTYFIPTVPVTLDHGESAET